MPSFAGLHELSTPGVHSTDIAAGLVSSCLTFSPLPISTFQLSDVSTFQTGGCFLLHLQTLADLFPLGSGMPCVARTFLSPVPFPPRSGNKAAASRFAERFSSQHGPCSVPFVAAKVRKKDRYTKKEHIFSSEHNKKAPKVSSANTILLSFIAIYPLQPSDPSPSPTASPHPSPTGDGEVSPFRGKDPLPPP